MHLRCRNLDVSGSRNASIYRAARTRVSVVKGSPDAYLATPFSSGRVRDSTDGLVPDVLELRHLRPYLAPRDSPFVIDNNRGGGFVGDRDKVRLHTVEYESDESAGKLPTSLSLKPRASSTPAPIHHPRALVPLLGHLA
ncbi:PFK domain-containing protein [Haematococcus lacustris]|uniref:PFK domain-containing protein n=1 Tax=Haematococcus lacustris TaxID=44745 RepID=A0A699ZJF1_HAELA|nr:PFK domain-containing protein [Haematococcus lacustris]